MPVDEVEIIPINLLPDAAPSAINLDTNIPVGVEDDNNSKKIDIGTLATVISEQIGTVTVPDPFHYRVDGPEPTDPTSAGGNRNAPDPALDGLDYTLWKWGVGTLRKGIEWQNDIVGGGWRLLDEDFLPGEMYVAFPKPEISNILAAPDAIARFTNGVALYPADATIGGADFRKLILINGAKNITLPLCSAYPVNVGLFISTSEGPQRQTTINRNGTDTIYSQAGTVTKFYLSNREFAVLITDGTKWYVQSCSDMVFKNPYPAYGWLPGLNQLMLDGSTYNRADLPKVFAFMEDIAATNPSAVLNGGDWLADRTKWGLGDVSLTFTVPDTRGTLNRALNGSRSPSLDADRTSGGTASLQGSLQLDDFESHSHNFNPEDVPGRSDNANDRDVMIPGSRTEATSFTGGSETRPINVGFFDLLNY